MKKMLSAGLLSVASVLLISGCSSSDSGTVTVADSGTVTVADLHKGGLVWENYTKTDADGTGSLPVGATNSDFVRCKACHGWDGKGLDGGYVRRSANAGRPNPTAGIGDISAQAMAGTVTIDDVYHVATGRLFSVEDQSMPNYFQDGGLTAAQASNVVAFLNSGEKLTTFADFDIAPNPVGYSFKGTSVAAGATLYTANCTVCHGADGTDTAISGVSLDAYFASDGKYSEGFHKVKYGIANTIMTRSAAGSLTGQETADVLAYIQDAIAPNYFKGGLVWDNYTNAQAGGAGALPAGATNKDFVRCKACHGWDGKGLAGGYVRRSANLTRPNPTAITGDLSGKMGANAVVGTVVAAEVIHDGTALSAITGRAFTTEDQTMPDYSQTGGLTAKQTADVVAFLNSGPKVTDHATLVLGAVAPVAYTFTGTTAAAGETLYTANCAGCHDANGKKITVDGKTGVGEYFSGDGKYSEGFHKIYYGANTSMTRASMGNLTSQEVADLLTYIQANVGGALPL